MNAIEQVEEHLSQDSTLPIFKRKKILEFLKNQKINILLTGPTGSGKSSTINALFTTEKAEIGFGVTPLTMETQKYDMGNLVLWDSPGLGDGEEEDRSHKKKIASLLNEKDEMNNLLIDLVVVIIDGSSRDMGTSFNLITNTIIPQLGSDPSQRILVAINQADLAYKGLGGWDEKLNRPTAKGEAFLEEKVISVKKRIKDSTGVEVDPIYYSAGFQASESIRHPYNLPKLLCAIIDKVPEHKRLAFKDKKINSQKDNWASCDNKENYSKRANDSIGLGTIIKGVLGIFGAFLGLF